MEERAGLQTGTESGPWMCSGQIVMPINLFSSINTKMEQTPMNLSSIIVEKMDVTGVIYAYVCFFNLIGEIVRQNNMADVERGDIMCSLEFYPVEALSNRIMPYASPEYYHYPFFRFKDIDVEERGLYGDMVRQIVKKRRVHKALMEKFREYYPQGHEKSDRLFDIDITSAVDQKMAGTAILRAHISNPAATERHRRDMALGVGRNAGIVGCAREEVNVFLTQEEIDVMLDFLSKAQNIYDRMRGAGKDFGCIWENLGNEIRLRRRSREEAFSKFVYAATVVFKVLNDNLERLSKKKEVGDVTAGYGSRYRLAVTYKGGYENLRRCKNGVVLFRFRAVDTH
jgi:hypothetical protein